MKFKTQSGSTYEVDFNSKQIRRLNGLTNSTPRQGNDGQWKKYNDLYPQNITVGHYVIILWAGDLPPTPETVQLYRGLGIEPPTKSSGPATITSTVTHIL